MQGKILWADDEIELLKPHILFLESKGYSVEAVTNGSDAIDKATENNFDIIFLDENMPGLSGLETLSRIKEIIPLIPIVMITKSEEEYIMEEAIGSKIADYLIKPVNPNQILLSLKKNLDQSKLVSQKTNSSYQQEFRQLGMALNSRMDINDWKEMYSKLVFWELELEKIEDSGMREILEFQKKEANLLFCEFIEDNYLNWLNGTEKSPDMIYNAIKNDISPFLGKEKVAVLVIDNLRYDQWKMVEPIFSKYFKKEEEKIIFTILPTATHYARNAFFSGLLPSEIEKKFPQFWKSEEDEGGKNMFEKELLETNLKRLGKNIKWSYTKITNLEAGKRLNDQFNQMKDNDAKFIVYNFVDMISHSRTEMEVMKELAKDEKAFRSLTVSWFEHSSLFSLIKKLQTKDINIIVTTDHGTTQVMKPSKCVGDRLTSTNIRYKAGKNLQFNEKDVYAIRKPEEAGLPQANMSTSYIFAKEDVFLIYQNNYNQFVNFFKDSFQHGGISLEEMIIPITVYSSKKR